MSHVLLENNCSVHDSGKSLFYFIPKSYIKICLAVFALQCFIADSFIVKLVCMV